MDALITVNDCSVAYSAGFKFVWNELILRDVLDARIRASSGCALYHYDGERICREVVMESGNAIILTPTHNPSLNIQSSGEGRF